MHPTLVAYGALGLAIICEVTGSSLLLKSQQFSKLVPTVGMAACFVAAMYFLSQALKVLPLGVAYAIWAGVGIILTALIGLVFFRQPLDIPAMIGIAMIVGGVVVMRAFSTVGGH